MKSLYLILFLFSLNLKATESNVFDENYPNFQNYQELVFSNVKNYFETLKSNSLIQITSPHTYQFKVTDVNNGKIVILKASIIRIQLPNKLIERVSYFNEQEQHFDYIVEKSGSTTSLSDDFDYSVVILY